MGQPIGPCVELSIGERLLSKDAKAMACGARATCASKSSGSVASGKGRAVR